MDEPLTYIEARAEAAGNCQRGETSRIKREEDMWVGIYTRPALVDGRRVLVRREETIGPVFVA